MMMPWSTRFRDVLPARYQVPAKYWYGRFRGALEAESALLGRLLSKQDRVLDVGGNRGVYAYELWRLGANVEVFEPNPVCFRILAEWAAGKPAVHLHPVALSNRAGFATLHIPIDAAGVEHDASGSIENAGFDRVRDHAVELQTLDSFGFEKVALIKIDVEGHEYRVIEGAATTLVSSKPVLLVEIEQRHNERLIGQVFSKILGFGYEGFFLDEGRVQVLSAFDPIMHQNSDNFAREGRKYIYNFLFVHRDRVGQEKYRALIRGKLK